MGKEQVTAEQRREGTRRGEKSRGKEIWLQTKPNWSLDNGYDGKLLGSKEQALTAKKKKQTNKKTHHVQALGLKDALSWTKEERSYKHFTFSCFIVSMVGFFVGLCVCSVFLFVCLLFGGEGGVCSSSLPSAIANQLGLLVWGASII